MMYGLIPLPERCESLGGCFSLPALPPIHGASDYPKESGLIADWLCKAMTLRASGDPHGYGDPRGAVAGEGDSRCATGAPPVERIELCLDPGLGQAEAYRLRIAEARIRIDAGGAAGLVRAAASLYQLALGWDSGSAAAQALCLPAVLIEDRPSLEWRGFMLDCARNFFRVDFIERLLDLAAMHKLNVFHWHLSDDQAWRLDLEGMPELAAFGGKRLDRRFNVVRWKGGTYSEAEVQRIVAYAAERHITVVPEIDLPGHSSALLAAHPELWCHSGHSDKRFEPEDRYGIFEGIVCPSKPWTLDLLGRVFDRLARLFPGTYVHAGGDEVPKRQWLLCDDCRHLMDSEGLRDSHGNPDPERLQAWFMNRLRDRLQAGGRRMAAWDEVVEGGCDASVLILAWRSQRHGLEAAAKGYQVVMCPQTRACYLDHKHLDVEEEPGQLGVCTVRDAYSFEPRPEGIAAATASNIIGAQANLWTELVYYGRQAEYLLFPRLCALSEVFWSARDRRNFDDFRKRLETHGRRLDRLGVARYRGPLEEHAHG